jgi:hypothetical protein
VTWVLRLKRAGLSVRKGEEGALRPDEEDEAEGRFEGGAVREGVGERTADMASGAPEEKLRRKEDERETEGRWGVVEPWEGRGGTGVDEGLRSSRCRWSSERIRGSSAISSCIMDCRQRTATRPGCQIGRTPDAEMRHEERSSLSASGLSSSSILPSSSSLSTLSIL